MASNSIVKTATKLVLLDLIGDFFYFPIWWYTVGLKQVVTKVVNNIIATADHLALRLLLLNIFKPMFAQYDRVGRIISFFMRIVILIARLLYFFVYSIVQLLLLLAWLVLPLLIIYRLFAIYILSYGAA